MPEYSIIVLIQALSLERIQTTTPPYIELPQAMNKMYAVIIIIGFDPLSL